MPPAYVAEMAPFDPLIGEYRVHYAGFFDPGFGYAEGKAPGAKAVLEVRSLDIPFILEDGQIVGRLVYDRLTEIPDQLYGERIGSHYQAQGLKLSKHFKQERSDGAEPSNRSPAEHAELGAMRMAELDRAVANMPPLARAASAKVAPISKAAIVGKQRAGQHHRRAAPFRFTTMRLEAHITSLGLLCRMPQQAVVISGTSTRSSISGNSTSCAWIVRHRSASRAAPRAAHSPRAASSSLSPQ